MTEHAEAGGTALLMRERRNVLWTLCLTEIVSWGVLYYAFAVLGHTIAEDTGWSLARLTALFSAALIVSRIPTFAMKSFSVRPQLAVGLLVLVALAAAAVVTVPRILLLILVGAYLLHIPFAIRSKRYVAARPEMWDRKPSERRAIRRQSPSRGAGRLGLRRPSGPSVNRANYRR